MGGLLGWSYEFHVIDSPYVVRSDGGDAFSFHKIVNLERFKNDFSSLTYAELKLLVERNPYESFWQEYLV